MSQTCGCCKRGKLKYMGHDSWKCNYCSLSKSQREILYWCDIISAYNIKPIKPFFKLSEL